MNVKREMLQKTSKKKAEQKGGGGGREKKTIKKISLERNPETCYGSENRRGSQCRSPLNPSAEGPWRCLAIRGDSH